MKGVSILYWGETTGFAGGIERYAAQTAAVLRSRGCRVDWCGVADGRDAELFRRSFDAVLAPAEALARSGEYRLAALHKIPSRETLVALREAFGDRLVFWAHDHDLYCPRHHYYTPFGRVNCRRAYAPLRCGLCARVTRPANWSKLRPGHTAILRELSAHRAVVLSDFMKENLLRNGFAAEAVSLVPPVVEGAPEVPSAALPAPGTPLRILYLGQLIRGKGVDLLLEALRLLTVPWRASIVGDGGDRGMLEAAAARYGIADLVGFTGWRSDPEKFFAECDVAVFPSRWQEPFGLSGAEAQAHGIPVVGFDVGGVREWLADGETGYAVPALDVRAMAAKLDLLGRDPALARRLGAAGREQMREKFAPERFLEAMEQLLRSVTP